MALVLSLVRHGQTEYNATGRLQGWCDSPLTGHGLAGVRVTAAQLRDRPFVAAYASPLGRTMATAAAILDHHPSTPLSTDPGLRELCFGDYEARPEIELLTAYDVATVYTEVALGTFPGFPGGESADAYLDRVAAAFARIERAHPDGEVLVVSHGLTLKAYLTMIDRRPWPPLPNASLSVVEVSDGSRRVVAAGLDLAAGDVLDISGSAPMPDPVA